MKLHANAALSWSGRRVLVDRGLVEGWTVTGAGGGGRGRRCQRALCAQVGWPLPRRGGIGSARSFVGAEAGGESHGCGSGGGDRGPAAVADDGRRGRRDACDAAL